MLRLPSFVAVKLHPMGFQNVAHAASSAAVSQIGRPRDRFQYWAAGLSGAPTPTGSFAHVRSYGKPSMSSFQSASERLPLTTWHTAGPQSLKSIVHRRAVVSS
jgi:hypothetical protein